MSDGAVLIEPKPKADTDAAAVKQLLALLRALVLLAPLVAVVAFFFVQREGTADAKREAVQARQEAADAKREGLQAAADAKNAAMEARSVAEAAKAALAARDTETSKELNGVNVKLARMEVVLEGLVKAVDEQKAKAGK